MRLAAIDIGTNSTRLLISDFSDSGSKILERTMETTRIGRNIGSTGKISRSSADNTLKTLMGLLKMFAREVAKADEIKFVPGYFPFTEPSVEAHIKHPKLGWVEMGGAGIFRPEVTKPMGIDVPVIAWGLGVDRMAMVAMGINDIRDLFSTDLNKIRTIQSSFER